MNPSQVDRNVSPNPSVAVVFGRPYAPYVERPARDLCRAIESRRSTTTIMVCVEDAWAKALVFETVQRVYVLPFDAESSAEASRRMSRLFPNGRPLVPFAVQDLCWDKLATQQRLVSRGVAVPETLVSQDTAEVRDFVRSHGITIFKARFGCAGVGHWVVWEEGAVFMADNGFNAYRLELAAPPARIEGDRLMLPPPYYVQKMIGTYTRGEFVPGQLLRAYVVDNEVRFWAERYRESYRRPGDWILNVSRGAKYRFLLSVSEETEKTALHAARAVGAPVAAVDIVRTATSGPLVLEIDTDGYHMFIDRSFKEIPEYRDYYDLDAYIGRMLASTEPRIRVRSLRATTPRAPGRGPRSRRG